MATISNAPVSIEQAQLDYRAGRKPQAEAACRRLIEQDPDNDRALHLLGLMALEVKQYALAAHVLMRAVNSAQQNAVYYVNLATALHGLGKLSEAADVLQLGISINPNLAEAHFNLAGVLMQLGDPTGSFAALERAVRLAPEHTEMLLEFARQLKLGNESDRAIEVYEKILGLRAAEVGILLEFCELLRLQRQFARAIDIAQLALEREPRRIATYIELSKSLLLQEREVDAIAVLEAAAAIDAQEPQVHAHLGYAFDAVGRVESAITSMQRAVTLAPDDPALLSNLIFLQAFSEQASTGLLLDTARRCNVTFARVASSAARAFGNDLSPSRRLRIGYVSGNFYSHCQSFFTLPLLEHHDAKAVEVYCYCDVTTPDQTTDRIRRVAHHWLDTSRMSHDEMTAAIERDRIDVLVDLTMHMGSNRLAVFAGKPAPVQICWLAYPGTTGLDAMDYRITDRYLDPPDSNDWPYSEQSLVLPDSFWCYDPLTTEVEPGPLPVQRNGWVTFGCLNHVRKINPTTLRLWARVMHQVRASRLLLHAPSIDARSRILHVLATSGIEPERVVFAGRLPRLDYLRLYQRIDIGLDTFPCQGHTTSLDAFWMGVPVVSLIGPVLVGRAALTITTNLQLTDLVYSSDESFVEGAVRLATQLNQLELLRATLRSRMQLCPLMDAPRFAKNMEAAYRLAWQRRCKQPPNERHLIV